MKMMLRTVPSLQRRLLYVLLASTLLFLVYLLSTNKEEMKVESRHGGGGGGLLDAIQPKQPEEFHLHREQELHLPKIEPVPTATHKQPEAPAAEKEPPAENKKNDPMEEVDLRPKIPASITTPTSKKPQQLTDTVLKEPLDRPHDPYAGPQNEQQKAVVEAFTHAWNAYCKYAWGHDELKPISHGWQEWMGVGLTIVDSLDTMWIMGLKDEFKVARQWVAANLTFDKDSEAQLFEIVIRELGGLMSAYHLTQDKIFLQKAHELGERLLPCFGGATSIPCSIINLKRAYPSFFDISTAECGTVQLEFRALARASYEMKYEQELGDRLMPCFGGNTAVPCRMVNLKSGRTHFQDISTAESGTLQLEFRSLGRALNDKYEKAVEAVSDHLHRLKKTDGLVPTFLSGTSGQFRSSSSISFGASADSYYEYLIKQWIQTGKKNVWMRDDYLESIEGMKKHLLKYTKPSNLAFVGSMFSSNARSVRNEMEHLTCFLPGTMALGYMAGVDPGDHLELAKKLTKTCYEMYRRMPTGLSPEVAQMNTDARSTDDIRVLHGTDYNLQRPETVESIFYLYRATKDPMYREWGWKIFQAFEKYTRVDEGYASLDSVQRTQPGFKDKMETFYLAETLKYLYLLFSDDEHLLPLDKWVFNTEAHPLPVYSR